MKTLSSKKKVLVIAASPHGYGHLFRGEMVSNYLNKNGFEVFYLSNQTEDFSNFSSDSLVKLKITLDNDVEAKKSRAEVLEYIYSFKFDYVIVDHFPLGKLFLLENFKNLHKRMHKHTKFVCVYRDVYSIEDLRDTESSLEILNNYFDKLLVFSDSNFLPLPNFLTKNISISINYLGYLDPDYNPQITIFGGGGKYNFDFYKQTLEVLVELGIDQQFKIVLFTGVNLQENDYDILRNTYPGICIERHCIDLMNEIYKSEITISTFGYNSFVQLLHSNNYNVIVPLPKNYQEQYERAKKFCELKKNSSIIMFDLKYKDLFAEKINHIIGRIINRNGLANLAEQLNEWK